MVDHDEGVGEPEIFVWQRLPYGFGIGYFLFPAGEYVQYLFEHNLAKVPLVVDMEVVFTSTINRKKNRHFTIGTGCRMSLLWVMKVYVHIKTLTSSHIAPQVMLETAQQIFSTAGINIIRKGDEILESSRAAMEALAVVGVAQCDDKKIILTQDQLLLASLRPPNTEREIVAFICAEVEGFAGCYISPPNAPMAVIDMEANKYVLAHEIGHLLGLEHCSNQDRLMFEGIASTRANTLVLTDSEKRLLHSNMTGLIHS